MKNNDVAKLINDQIINAIDNGVAPWKKPWRLELTPKSVKSKKNYTGINALVLSAIQSCKCYTTGEWITFKELNARGLKLAKGSKGAPVVFYTLIEKKGEVDEEGNKKQIPCLKYFNVFNLSCTDADPAQYIPVVNDAFTADEKAEKMLGLIKNKIPQVLEGGKACYRFSKVDDFEEIRIPPKQTFENSQEYYSTLFHEVIHSTGHSSRLDREHGAVFADEKYSFEELIAEIGACYLMSYCGIEGALENSAAYLRGWREKLLENQNWIIKASKKATDAVNFLLGTESPFFNNVEEVVTQAA